MANTVTELKMAVGAGARPNKYRVNFAIPAAVPQESNLQNVDLLCKAASFPGVTIGQIELWNQGRKLVIPGDTDYGTTWALTFYATEDHALRTDLIGWMRYIDHWQANSHSGSPTDVMTELSVEQLDSAGTPTAKYTFHNVFVQDVGEITVGDDQNDTAIEFDVTFSFTDWVVGDGALNEPSSGDGAMENSIAE